MPEHPSDRRDFLRIALGFAAAWASGGRVLGDEPSGAACDRARRFLASLFAPDLGLLPEFRGSKVSWLYHDNYLAAKVLERTEPDLSRRIREAIRGFGVTRSGKTEILFGESPKPLPFRHYRLEEVERGGDKVVRTEVVGEKVHDDWDRYADLLFLAAIAESAHDKEKALGHLEAGFKAWDGSGIRDKVIEKNGLYATYKLALALIAAARVGRKSDDQAMMQKQLLAMQRADGGFVTDYNAKGKPVGQANVETTSLAILALAG